METIRYKGRANVVVYENNDVEVRVPQENEALKQVKLKETPAGTLSQTQGRQPLLQLRAKVKADTTDPAGDLRDEVDRLLKGIDDADKSKMKLASERGCRWLCRNEDLKVRADSESVVIQLRLPIGNALEINERLTSKISEIYSCLVTQRRLLSQLAFAAKQPTVKS